MLPQSAPLMALWYVVAVVARAWAVGIQHGLQLTAMAGGIFAGLGCVGHGCS